MRILIDCDETLLDLHTPVLSLYNKKYNDDLTKDKLLTYDTKLYTKNNINIYKEFCTQDVLSNLKPVDTNAIKIIKSFIDNGNEVYFVTAVYPKNVYPRHKNLEKLFGEYYTYDMLIPLVHKDLIVGDIMIDDCPYNFYDNTKYHLLYNQPWNEYKYEDDRLIRVTDWNDINNIINKL